MARRAFQPPVQADDAGWRVNLDAEERALLVRLMGELRDLLLEGDGPLLERLFPTAYPDDDEAEDEYQRLMRDELVASRLDAIGTVTATLGPDGPERLTEEQTVALMQSVNAVRLVLGTMLGISDDDAAEQADAASSPEHQLYGYLSWLLEWTVQSLS
jgi:hypothetical protein